MLQARISLGLCRAHLCSARSQWEAALRELEALHISDVTAQNHLYAVPAGWLRAEALLALERAGPGPVVLEAKGCRLGATRQRPSSAPLHLSSPSTGLLFCLCVLFWTDG